MIRQFFASLKDGKTQTSYSFVAVINKLCKNFVFDLPFVLKVYPRCSH